MQKPFDFVTFDCYGTLIDWETGIRNAFLQAAREDGVHLDESLIIAEYAAAERQVEQEPHRRYRDVLAVASSRAGEALGWRVSRPAFLAESLPSWPPFIDTNPALERLRAAGIRLGILSNVDDDLLTLTRRHFTAGFDLVITAEQVRSYKPAPAHFLAARERLAGARWIHAAQSNFHDIVPTNLLRIPNAWINRKASSPLAGGKPAMELSDLTALADALT